MKLSLMILFLLASILSYGQQKTIKNAHKDSTKKLIFETEKKEENTINTILKYKQKIRAKNNQIYRIYRSINMLDYEYKSTTEKINILANEALFFKEKYFKLINVLYFHIRNKASVFFSLFSKIVISNQIQIYKIFDITSFIKTKILTYYENISELEKKSKTIENYKSYNNIVLLKKQNDANKLNSEKEKNKRILKKLQKRKTELLKELQYQENQQKILRTNVINSIEQSQKTQDTIPENTDNKDIKVNEKQLTLNFEKRKGTLKLPIENGEIKSYFGAHLHPYIEGIYIRNDGIELSVKQDANVKSVFKGIVTNIVKIPGANYSVIVKHGDYYTVYANLINLKIKKNQLVKEGQVIGLFKINKNDQSNNFKFQIWHLKEKIDPLIWIKN